LILLAWLLTFDLGSFSSTGRMPATLTVGITIIGVSVAIAVLAVAARTWLRWRRGDWEA
jgi:hypothetical protein